MTKTKRHLKHAISLTDSMIENLTNDKKIWTINKKLKAEARTLEDGVMGYFKIEKNHHDAVSISYIVEEI